MAVWKDARWLARLAGEQLKGRRRYDIAGTPTQAENQELAEVMRRLPERYADRLTPRTLQGISGAAAAGQWEQAVDRLLAALRARSAPVTAGERDELHMVLAALRMPADRVDALVPPTDATSRDGRRNEDLDLTASWRADGAAWRVWRARGR
ncbi:hypothetical protein SAMN04489712_11717 [Thermomonospora echinospora]|uniref:Uncharacterized protein n=1 Tax=Thermomonospora echinospora TaxID=1992 RepID=A0A1H6DIK5_9ACTN|nr:DUF6189 family protein [Thermomonospora echinospora]SEG84515.1 hypothetical protein SAMN04489712_11717 [Thermomonospora echinospora]